MLMEFSSVMERVKHTEILTAIIHKTTCEDTDCELIDTLKSSVFNFLLLLEI